MSNKKEKKNVTKETPKNGRTLMLKLDNGVKRPASIVYDKQNNNCFETNEIDLNKIRVSEKKLYCKKYNSQKYYVLYKHNNEYIPLRVISRDVVAYYSVYGDNKKMNFSVNDKLISILEHIEEKLKITFADFSFGKKWGRVF